MRTRTAVAAIVCALVAIIAMPARAQTPSVEEELLGFINLARGEHSVVMHAGLREVARKHSEAMATAESLNHRRAKARIDTAQPDRPEANGAPDDGFTGTWCEVVGWEPAGADAGVARRFFDDWRETAEDNRCMTNSQMTVAGLGVYERGNRWWATLEMSRDTTRPRPTARPATTPATSLAPIAAAHSTPVSDLAQSRSTATTNSSGRFPWREIAVAVVGFSVVPILYATRRRAARRRAARV